MHYFENDKNVKSEPKDIEVYINKSKFKFTTDSGVFSKKGLDFGTRSLLESLPISKINGDVLDLGCGYGPIGIYVASLKETLVDMVDVNERAILLAQKNAKGNNVSANIFHSNGYENIVKKYDYIISNPPIRVGKETLYNILFEAKKHLKQNGELWIVINKAQGAKSTLKDLMKSYDAKLVNKNKGFYIIKAVNR